MVKNKSTARNHRGLQAITLCISTALVLILLGMVVFSVLTAHNLSVYVKENLTVTVMLNDDVTNPEAQRLCKELGKRSYINGWTFISKEQALEENKKEMGADPSEFVGVNPFLSSIELQLKSNYANSDSLKWITKELKKDHKINEISYPQDLMDSVNANLKKINLVLIILAILLTIVSFSLINNSIKLGVYARRFTIHTMKLVGASWSFIRAPFLKNALLIGILASLIAILVLGGGIYALYVYEPNVLSVITWQVMLITGLSVLFFGLLITFVCSYFSVNRFLKMKACDLYKI
ncbi:MAG: permease-like cell division protein FtsX [Prevotella sp.]|nr:permease-like cell division protein FtsX [Prevotella sp.]